MSSTGNQPDLSAEVEVQLLDTTVGTAIKSWRFNGRPEISIGRGEECAVEILDPHVSRLHATLSLRGDQWVLSSQGRNGVVVDGKLITEKSVQEQMTFRLGPSGPSLRFNLAADSKKEFLQTLSFDSDEMPFYQLDQAKLQDEVAAVTDDDFFQSLQKRAKELRRQRKEA